MSIVLASQSPRRKELLAKITQDFIIKPSEVDESIISADSPAALCLKLAETKCMDVADSFSSHAVIGCDTVVECNGMVLGKPKNREDAVRMLRMLSGKIHYVHTAVCVAFEGKKELFCHTSSVEFFDIDPVEIEGYVQSGEPMDKAGAYAIQGGAALFVKEIRGDYYSIMGLPVGLLNRCLKNMGVI